jgi:general secretion pathway protein J
MCSGCNQANGSVSRFERGFTLLELLAGMALFSLVVMTLYSGFRIGLRSWEATEGANEGISEARLASAFIRRQLGKAMPLVVTGDGARKLWFVGEHDRLVFITDVAPYLGQAGPYEMTLAVERGDSRRLTLTRRALGERTGAVSGAWDAQSKSLVDDLENAEFAYYGVPARGVERGWHTRWDGAERLPSLVKIRVTSKLAGEWPELMVHLNVDGTRYWRGPALAQRGPAATPVQLARAGIAP